MSQRGNSTKPGGGLVLAMPGLAGAAPGASRSGTVDIGPMIDDARWSGFQKMVLALVSLTIVLDGLDTQTLSLALPTIIRDWGISRAPFGLVLAVSFIAMAIGTAWGGLLGDRFGRRGALLASMIIFGAGTLAGAATYDVWSLGLTRIIASVGIGSAMPNATALVAEYTPRRQRSFGIGIAMDSVPVGAFLGGMLAAFILPRGSWQMLFLVCGFIPLAGVVLLAAMLPESIRFLLGRPGAGPKIAALLRKCGNAVHDGDHFIDTAEEHAASPSLGHLFTPAYLQDTVVLSAAFFLIIGANLFIISWAPSLLADLGYPPGIASTGVAVYSVGGLFGGVGGSALFARLGSRVALSLAFGVAVATLLVLAVAPIGPGGFGATGLICLLLLGGIAIPGGQVLLFSLAGQIYPTTVRSTGVGFAAAMGRIGAVVSGLVGPFLLVAGPSGFFSAAAAAMLACGMVVQFARTRVLPSRSARLADADART